MYRMLLCLRYLRTRYIALASIISVTLGVATMIVVNSVMAGFQQEMYQRLRGILADVLIESHSMEGIENPDAVLAEVRNVLGEDLAGVTTNVHVPAMVSFRLGDQWQIRQVNLVGIEPETYSNVGDFGQYLLHAENRHKMKFDLRDGGYDERMNGRLDEAGWTHRRNRVVFDRAWQQEQVLRGAEAADVDGADASGDAQDPGTVAEPGEDTEVATADTSVTLTQTVTDETVDPFGTAADLRAENVFDPLQQIHTGIVLGIGVVSVRQRDTSTGQAKDFFLCRPGDDVKVTLPSAGAKPKPVHCNFTVVDVYESKMSEYDSNFAFMPLTELQALRWYPGAKNVTSIQIKLRPEANLAVACQKLREHFPVDIFRYRIETWRELQGPLFAAVRMETNLLNILLFLIIAVAGFGILATFFMIVVEKTRDIGILKSLGASSRGVLSIFLSYGLCLGAVGSGAGMVLGLLFVANINRIAALIEALTGHEVFDQTVYYFQEIPTIVYASTVSWIVFGAVLIALLASVLPALRAARLNPVEALRYE